MALEPPSYSSGQRRLLLFLSLTFAFAVSTQAFSLLRLPTFPPYVPHHASILIRARICRTNVPCWPRFLHRSAPCPSRYFWRRQKLQLRARGDDSEDHEKDPSLWRSGLLRKRIARSDSYQEESRQYRRTVFEHHDWVRFRSSHRLVRNLQSMLVSGVIRGLWLEVSTVSAVAALVCFWNLYVFPFLASLLTSLASSPGLAQSLLLSVGALFGPLHLPTLPFRISSPALGLLLVFRTNSCYARWKEGWQAWVRLAEHCKSLCRMGMTYLAEEEKEEFIRRVMAIPRACKCDLRGGEAERRERDKALQELLGEAEASRLAGLPPDLLVTEALLDVSAMVKRAKLESSTRAGFDRHLDGLTASVLFCDRLLHTPVPLVYTRHTSRFLAIFMTLLPLALYDALRAKWLTLPITAVVAIFFFGIEELGVQIEEPFSILPLGDICDNVEMHLRAMLQYDRQRRERKHIGTDAQAWL